MSTDECSICQARKIDRATDRSLCPKDEDDSLRRFEVIDLLLRSMSIEPGLIDFVAVDANQNAARLMVTPDEVWAAKDLVQAEFRWDPEADVEAMVWFASRLCLLVPEICSGDESRQQEFVAAVVGHLVSDQAVSHLFYVHDEFVKAAGQGLRVRLFEIDKGVWDTDVTKGERGGHISSSSTAQVCT